MRASIRTHSATRHLQSSFGEKRAFRTPSSRTRAGFSAANCATRPRWEPADGGTFAGEGINRGAAQPPPARYVYLGGPFMHKPAPAGPAASESAPASEIATAPTLAEC